MEGKGRQEERLKQEEASFSVFGFFFFFFFFLVTRKRRENERKGLQENKK